MAATDDVKAKRRAQRTLRAKKAKAVKLPSIEPLVDLAPFVDKAACREHPELDWFSEADRMVLACIEICEQCPSGSSA